MLGQKSFGSKKFWVIKIFGKKIFWVKKFWANRNYGQKDMNDIWIIGYQMDYFNWVNISSGSENITLKVQNLFVCTIKEPARIELITRAKRNNQRIWGLKLSNLNFSDWDEVKRTLDMVETFTHLSMLDLSQN